MDALLVTTNQLDYLEQEFHLVQESCLEQTLEPPLVHQSARNQRAHSYSSEVAVAGCLAVDHVALVEVDHSFAMGDLALVVAVGAVEVADVVEDQTAHKCRPVKKICGIFSCSDNTR